MLPPQISPETMYGKHSSGDQPAGGAGDDEMSLFLRHLLSSSSSPSADRGKDPIRPSFAAAAGGGVDGDDYEWESEEGAEPEEEGAAKAVAKSARAGSKRSRAAEVHNLSEKRRRSRINEKMKALQNLIPNSNKTDKASMLDEAIEYLKQLQLQVQMLSMRNGMSLHPVYMPGAIQSLQIPNYANGYATSDCPIQLNNLSVGSFSVGEERQAAHGLPHQNSPSVLQPLALSNTLDIRKPTVAAVMDVSRSQQLPFPLPTSTMDLHGNESLLGQNDTDTSLSKQSDVRSSLANKEANCLEGSMLEHARLHFMGSDNNAQSEILIRQLDREEDACLLMGPKFEKLG